MTVLAMRRRISGQIDGWGLKFSISPVPPLLRQLAPIAPARRVALSSSRQAPLRFHPRRWHVLIGIWRQRVHGRVNGATLHTGFRPEDPGSGMYQPDIRSRFADPLKPQARSDLAITGITLPSGLDVNSAQQLEGFQSPALQGSTGDPPTDWHAQTPASIRHSTPDVPRGPAAGSPAYI